METTERRLVAVTLALAVCTACGGLRQAQRIGAPDDSYRPTRLTVVIDGSSEVLDGAVVTPRFFTAEDVKPLLGRFFVEADYMSDHEATAVLSHGYWAQRFRSTPSVIGSTITIEGRSRVIVGVAPAAFQPDRGGSLWIPQGG